MSATQAVSQSALQSAPANLGGAPSGAASGQLAGNAFEQALFQFLQSSLVSQPVPEQAVDGLELPTGGDKLPSVDAILQQLSQTLSPEQMQEVQALLNGEEVNEASLPEDLLNSVKDLLQGVESGVLSQDDLQQLQDWLAESEKVEKVEKVEDQETFLSGQESKSADVQRDVDVRGAAGVSDAINSQPAPPVQAETVEDNEDVVVKTLAESTPTEKANETVQQASVSPVPATQDVASSKNTATEVRTEVRASPTPSAQPVLANNQQSSGDASSQQQSGSQHFREALIAQRTDANARESADSSRTGFGHSFVLSGQSASEPVARLNTNMSGFQQLQQMYAGDSSSQVALSAGARFGAADWAPNISQRIAWMANQQVGHAEIRLDPPDLGSLNIRLSVQNDQATVTFISPNPQVRDALEQQMPRLREMLEEYGIQLENGDVAADSGRQDREGKNQDSGTSGFSEKNEGGMIANAGGSDSGNLNLVDYYA